MILHLQHLYLSRDTSSSPLNPTKANILPGMWAERGSEVAKGGARRRFLAAGQPVVDE
jgi:hypothetical protein